MSGKKHATSPGRLPFDSIYSHGFVRAAVALPRVKVADPRFNALQVLDLARQAAERHAALVVYPELTLTGYSNDDLFHQGALLEAARSSLDVVLEETARLAPILVVGLPLLFEGKVFNCAAVVQGGRVLGVVPKSYLPNYREYYEKRYFAAGEVALGDRIRLGGEEVPFGSGLVFDVPAVRGFTLAVEICEDLWSPIPPTTWAALAGATVLCNLSASNVTIGKLDYRRLLCRGQSGRCVAAYIYAGAGAGESTTDLAWDGHGVVAENGEIIGESERFSQESQLLCADVDLGRLESERIRLSSFTDSVRTYRDRLTRIRRLPVAYTPPRSEVPLDRVIDRLPYVPSSGVELDERCYEAYSIQVHGLVQRLRATGIEKVVIGVSGGLDSTHALIVSVKSMDELGLPRTNVLGYTMPGFATSERTYRNSLGLMKALGVTSSEIDIRPSSIQMLEDIDHPYSEGEPVHDVTFENVQAGERTSHLFRLANHHGALVVGTSDLSELALGWTTYGVGDHMSHYAVNSSVPKTLIQHLIRWVIRSGEVDSSTGEILQSILDTEISPELVPGDGEEGQPGQSTEERIGPYELQDFNLYHITRYGFRPSKVAFLAAAAWADRHRGTWPPMHPEHSRNEYDLAAIRRWLEVFLDRFFRLSQFKRSALPNGPKVGSGGSLSPRGDWRAPSDADAEAWLQELRENVPEK